MKGTTPRTAAMIAMMQLVQLKPVALYHLVMCSGVVPPRIFLKTFCAEIAEEAYNLWIMLA